MISDRRGAPGRLGSLFPKLPSQQLGIGYYESVGASAAPEPTEQPTIAPQVVSAPEEGDAQLISQRAAAGVVVALGIFACGAVAMWAGNEFVRQMKGLSA